MTIFLDFVASTVKAFFLFMTFDFVKVTIKSRFHVGSTINFVHYVDFSHCKAGYGLSCSIQRDVGHLALLFVGQEGVAEGFLFGVLGKEACEGVGTDVADFYVNAN